MNRRELVTLETLVSLVKEQEEMLQRFVVEMEKIYGKEQVRLALLVAKNENSKKLRN